MQRCIHVGKCVHRHADDVVFEPVLTLVEYLVVHPGGQVDGIAGCGGITVVVVEDFAAARQHVVHLLEIVVPVVIRRLAPATLTMLSRRISPSIKSALVRITAISL